MILAFVKNPYSEVDFWGFFQVFFSRIFEMIQGKIAFSEIASDEVQLFALFGVGALGTLVGVFLALRRLTMVANALSHTLLFGVVITFLCLFHWELEDGAHGLIALPILFASAIGTAFLTTALTEWLHKKMRLPEDASIGLVFFSLFALGILLISFASKNLHLGLELIVGNIDGMRRSDLGGIYLVVAISATLISLFFKELKITTFDLLHAKTLGISCNFYHYLLMGITAISLVSTFQVVGVLMTLAFFVGPPLIARLYAKRMVTVFLMSMVIVFCASLAGLALSRALLSSYGLSLSTSGIVVGWLLFFYIKAQLVRIIIKKWNRKKIGHLIFSEQVLKS